VPEIMTRFSRRLLHRQFRRLFTLRIGLVQAPRTLTPEMRRELDGSARRNDGAIEHWCATATCGSTPKPGASIKRR
jgi:hypothetical protein